MTSWEVYKQIWLLLVTDQSITIKCDSPSTMKDRDNLSIFSQSASESTVMPESGHLSSGTKAASSKQVMPAGGLEDSKA